MISVKMPIPLFRKLNTEIVQLFFDENIGNSQESENEEVENEVEGASDAFSDTSVLNRVCKAICSVTEVIDNQRKETRELSLYLEFEMKAANRVPSSVVSEVSSLEKRQFFLKERTRHWWKGRLQRNMEGIWRGKILQSKS